MKYSVIIPCYNEEAVLFETQKRLSRVMSAMDGDYELVYINDGSRDRTPEMLRDMHEHDPEHVKVVMFARNAGHQIAVSAGLDYASGDAIVIIDADLQDPPELIPVMAERWKQGAKVVYGKRKAREGESFLKKATASAYYRIIGKMTNGMVPRDTGDFRLVDKQVADVIRNMPEHARFLRGMFAWAGFRQEAVEYDREKRFAGTTHYPLRKMLKLAADGIYSFSSKPLKLASFLGLLYLFLGIFGGLTLLVLLLCGIHNGFAWLAVLVLFTSGTLHLAVGIAGEYLARVYDETRQRPLYIVADTLGF